MNVMEVNKDKMDYILECAIRYMNMVENNRGAIETQKIVNKLDISNTEDGYYKELS